MKNVYIAKHKNLMSETNPVINTIISITSVNKMASDCESQSHEIQTFRLKISVSLKKMKKKHTIFLS